MPRVQFFLRAADPFILICPHVHLTAVYLALLRPSASPSDAQTSLFFLHSQNSELHIKRIAEPIRPWNCIRIEPCRLQIQMTPQVSQTIQVKPPFFSIWPMCRPNKHKNQPLISLCLQDWPFSPRCITSSSKLCSLDASPPNRPPSRSIKSVVTFSVVRRKPLRPMPLSLRANKLIPKWALMSPRPLCSSLRPQRVCRLRGSHQRPSAQTRLHTQARRRSLRHHHLLWPAQAGPRLLQRPR